MSSFHHSVSQALMTLDAIHVRQIWESSLQRIYSEPEGAITSARTLLESIHKTILDDCSPESYKNDADLTCLCSLVFKALELHPNQQSEEVMRAMLGSCMQVVQRLGEFRNKNGDAHGVGRNYSSISSRYAELAVNLAGAVSVFLIRSAIEQDVLPVAVEGIWRGTFCGDQLGILTITQNGRRIEASLNTNCIDQTFVEKLHGTVNGREIELEGRIVLNQDAGSPANYHLDKFSLTLASDNHELAGKVYDLYGEYDAQFVKEEGP